MMSHKSKKGLRLQAKEVFDSLSCIGQKKHDVKEKAYAEYERLTDPQISKQEYYHDQIRDKIYSVSTYNSYAKQNNYFFDWCEQTHGCTTLDQCRQYVDEWLTRCIDKGLSPSTLAIRKAGLAKLYQVPSTAFRDTPPIKLDEITRSRGPAIRDKGLSLEKNADYIEFCRSTGLRVSEVKQVTSMDLIEYIDGSDRVYLEVKGKGGRVRHAPIIGDVDRIRDMIASADGKVWQKIPSHADTHSYRADYATAIYTALARPVEEIPRSERYYCRGSRKGLILDKKALKEVSEALGHSRISVTAEHYIRNIRR